MIYLFLLYDILFFWGLLLVLPWYFFRKKLTLRGLLHKLSFFTCKDYLKVIFKKSIWIQVVSVGEVLLIKNFVNQLISSFAYPLVISVTTRSGKEVADKIYSSCASVIYFPYDISLVIRRMIKAINPCLFITVETEMWPNLFYQLKRKHIPIIVLNGRISSISFKKYKKIIFLMKRVLNWVSFLGVQNEIYRQRFLYLGADKERIAVTGNMKFTSLACDEKYFARFKNKYGNLKQKGEILFVVGSTHHPEEEMILKVYTRVRKDYPNLILLLAPRHIERIPKIERTIKSLGLSSLRISQIDKLERKTHQVYLLDSVGELFYFYGIADICFVGGSLANYGGHNILEPLYFSKPTIFGRYMSNFPDVKEKVLKTNSAVMVKDERELETSIIKIIKDEEFRRRLSANSLEVFKEEKENLKKNINIITRILGDG
ncbi:MAG: hypothetical protein B6D55_03365 [Candidatus Omnitrophica bacterium 4484_70.2]|nr:MAG: hypothetical protein B6D55_03365 [Candidatus Omnitrophica bacterium 4484_70.2]